MSVPAFTPQKRRDRSRTVRYTVDMNPEQHKFLKVFAVDNDVRTSVVFKSLLYLLETRSDLAILVMQTIDTLEGSRALNDRNNQRKMRYTVDLDWQQHTFLKLFATHNDVVAANIVRCLVILLEQREDLAFLVISTIFEEDDDFEEDEDQQEIEEIE